MSDADPTTHDEGGNPNLKPELEKIIREHQKIIDRTLGMRVEMAEMSVRLCTLFTTRLEQDIAMLKTELKSENKDLTVGEEGLGALPTKQQ